MILNGTLDSNNHHIINTNFGNYSESLNRDFTIINGILNIDLKYGNTIVIELNQNVTEIIIVNTNDFDINRIYTFTLIVKQHNTTAYNITWPSSIKWEFGESPTISPILDSIAVLNFMTYNAGTFWLGFINALEME